jgi:SAM-dependent methyltransferase
MNLDDTEPFDLVLDMFAALGYCEDPVDDIRAVTAFYEALKPGGQVFIATRHPQSPSGRFKHTSVHGYCIEERRFERTTGHMVTQWTVSGPRNRVHHSTVRLYEAKDLHGLLSVCGFRDIQISEQPAAERIIVIGTVPVPPTSD